MSAPTVTREQLAQTIAWVEQVIGGGAPHERTPELWARSLLAVLGFEVEPARGDVIDGRRAGALGNGAVVIRVNGLASDGDAPALTCRADGRWEPAMPHITSRYEVLRLPRGQEKETPT